MPKKFDITTETGVMGKPTESKPVKVVLTDEFVTDMSEKYDEWYPVKKNKIKGYDGDSWDYESIPSNALIEVIRLEDLDD